MLNAAVASAARHSVMPAGSAGAPLRTQGVIPSALGVPASSATITVAPFVDVAHAGRLQVVGAAVGRPHDVQAGVAVPDQRQAHQADHDD